MDSGCGEVWGWILVVARCGGGFWLRLGVWWILAVARCWGGFWLWLGVGWILAVAGYRVDSGCG